MKDKDIKYCEEQIKKKESVIDSLMKQLEEYKLRASDFQELEQYYKQEKKEILEQVQAKNKEIHKEQCELGNMKRHKRELRKTKMLLAYQHRCVDKENK